MTVSQKIGYQLTSRKGKDTFGHKYKGRSIILQEHLFNYVYTCIVCNGQNLETTLDTPKLKNGLRKYGTNTQWSAIQQFKRMTS